MNTRLKIICILFGIVYFYFVGSTLIQSAAPDFIAGFKEGYKEAKVEKKLNKETDRPETVFLYVKPVSGMYSFPSSVLNLKTGNPMRTEFSKFNVRIDKTHLPKWIEIASFLFGIITVFPLIFAILFIPIQIYKVIRSIVKNEIFELRNINRLRRIGYCLLFIFIAELFFNFINTVEAQTLIHLQDYQIVFRMTEEYYWLLFGLVTLMFAEILKISHSMKEEQELTI